MQDTVPGTTDTAPTGVLRLGYRYCDDTHPLRQQDGVQQASPGPLISEAQPGLLSPLLQDFLVCQDMEKVPALKT